jgi:hypothetical protein
MKVSPDGLMRPLFPIVDLQLTLPQAITLLFTIITTIMSMSPAKRVRGFSPKFINNQINTHSQTTCYISSQTQTLSPKFNDTDDSESDNEHNSIKIPKTRHVLSRHDRKYIEEHLNCIFAQKEVRRRDNKF